MWNGNFGDYIWDTVTNLVDDEKDEKEAKKQALRGVIELMIERDNKEIYQLKKFKRMIEEGWDD